MTPDDRWGPFPNSLVSDLWWLAVGVMGRIIKGGLP